MTLAVMALYADGPTRLTQHRQLARQGDRPHRRDGHRAAQARRRRSSKAPTSSRSRRRRAGAPRRSTPTTTTAWRCACRWPRSTRWPARSAGCRCASSTRAASAKTFPDYFETLFGVVAAPTRRTMPVITDRRPDRLRQGHAGRARGRARSATTSGLRRAVPRHRAGRAAATASAPTTKPALARAGRRAGPALRRRPRLARAAATSATRCAREDVGALASRVSALAGGARGAARRCSWPSAALPGPGGRRARHGHGDLPRRRAQGVPHRERRRARRAPA